MRTLVFSFVLVVFSSVLTPTAIAAPSPEKVLIVYLSRTNNTKVLAEIIHRYVGGELVPLELQKPYPENYEEIVQQVARENETGFLPPLKTEFRDLARYDVIFVGFPAWGIQLPPPMKTFLKQHDLSGKTVVPFDTNGGYGLGTSFQMVRELCPDSHVLEGYSVKGGNERDGVFLAIQGERAEEVRQEIKRWLNRLALSNEGADEPADQPLRRSLAVGVNPRHAREQIRPSANVLTRPRHTGSPRVTLHTASGQIC